MFSRFLNFKEFVLFYEVGNFRSVPVLGFGPYIEIKNSEMFSSLVSFKALVLFEEIGNLSGFWVFIFGACIEINKS